jgi:hypothetical protein
MSVLEAVGILWVLLTSIAGHLMFALLAWAGAKAIVGYIRELEGQQQSHKPEIIRKVTGG